MLFSSELFLKKSLNINSNLHIFHEKIKFTGILFYFIITFYIIRNSNLYLLF